MRCTLTSTILALLSKTTAREHPTIKEINEAQSIHVIAFSSKHDLLLAESEGRFNMEDWDMIENMARIICLGDTNAMVDGDEKEEALQQLLRSVVGEKVARDERWKNG